MCCVPHLTFRRLPPGSLCVFIFTKHGLVHCHLPFFFTRFFGEPLNHGWHLAIWAYMPLLSPYERSLCDWPATSVQAVPSSVWWLVQDLESKCSSSSGGVIGAKARASDGVLGGGPGGVRGVIRGVPAGLLWVRKANSLTGKPIGKIHADLSIAGRNGHGTNDKRVTAEQQEVWASEVANKIANKKLPEIIFVPRLVGAPQQKEVSLMKKAIVWEVFHAKWLVWVGVRKRLHWLQFKPQMLNWYAGAWPGKSFSEKGLLQVFSPKWLDGKQGFAIWGRFPWGGAASSTLCAHCDAKRCAGPCLTDSWRRCGGKNSWALNGDTCR